MLDDFKDRDPGKPLHMIVGYAVFRAAVAILYAIFFRARSFGTRNLPTSGGVLLVANHQSYLDPPLVGTASRPRHTYFLARASLFKFKPFGQAIAFLNSIPIRDDSGDAVAIRAILARLQEGHPVLLFPEGNRCEDGAMAPFKRGAALIVKRSKCPVLPVAVEGCFDVWPRFSPLPRVWRCPIFVRFGRPIPHDELMKDGADAALRRLEGEIETMRLGLRRLMRRQSGGVYPARGPGDERFVYRPAEADRAQPD